MDADISTLYFSDFYQVLNFKCRCLDCNTSKPEYVDTFSISFVRKGNFLFNVFRNSFDAHTGRVLLTKPGYEHTVTHMNAEPDECTIIEFTPDFYAGICQHYQERSFFVNNDIHSIQIKTSPDTEYLHHYLLSQIFSRAASRLEIDSIVLEIIEKSMSDIAYTAEDPISIRLKKNHLRTIEQAKNYMLKNLSEDISLMDIASECCVSIFHFSRVFKVFTGISPHAFLLSLRLKNAELLLKTSRSPITEIAFASGFNSLEHFSATFSDRYKQSPKSYKETLQKEY